MTPASGESNFHVFYTFLDEVFSSPDLQEQFFMTGMNQFTDFRSVAQAFMVSCSRTCCIRTCTHPCMLTSHFIVTESLKSSVAAVVDSGHGSRMALMVGDATEDDRDNCSRSCNSEKHLPFRIVPKSSWFHNSSRMQSHDLVAVFKELGLQPEVGLLSLCFQTTS